MTKKIIRLSFIIGINASLGINAQEKKDSLSTKDIQEVLINPKRKSSFPTTPLYKALEKQYFKDLIDTLNF